jgi:hypothetical protein
MLTLKGAMGRRSGNRFRKGLSYLTFLPDGGTLVSSTPEEVRLWHAPSWAEIESGDAKEKVGAR